MRYFQLMARGVEVFPLAHALQQHPELWNQNTLRTAHPGTAHAEADDILVWFNEIGEHPEDTVVDDRDVIPFPAWEQLPQIRPLVFGLMQQVSGVRLGRVLITRLAPGRSITPHTDGGAPATFFSRYQIALQSLPGCVFGIEEEKVDFETGEIWYINNEARHYVTNNSADDRLALIVDVRTA